MSATQNQKRVLLVVGGIIALIAVAATTVFILSRLNASQTAKPQDNISTEAATAPNLINNLRQNLPASVSGLAEQQASDGQFKIAVKLSSKPFSVAISTKDILWLSEKEKKPISNASAVISDAKTYFEARGMREMLSNETAASFEGANTVCQVQVQTNETGGVLYGCASSQVVKDEYDTIAKLIGLYNQANTDVPLVQTSFASVERTTQQQDTVKGAILSILLTAPANSGKVLLYGAMGDTWEYVADLTTGTSSGKANVSDAALPLIKDKKWNGVLAGLVGVE